MVSLVSNFAVAFVAGVFLLITTFSFFFVYWKKLSEDYTTELVFDSAFMVIFSSVCLAALFFLVGKFLPERPFYYSGGLWFWGGFLGFLGSSFLVAKKKKVNFNELFDSGVLAFMPLYAAILLYMSLVIKSLEGAVFAIFVLALVGVYLFLNSRYKSIHWYKSGKLGFSSLLSLGVFFLARSMIAIVNPNMVSFVGAVEVIVSGVAAFLMFFAVYDLSQK